MGTIKTSASSHLAGHRIITTPFASVYPYYVNKAERKGRTKDDVDEVICWLTGYDQAGLAQVLEQQVDFDNFFASAPAMNPNCHLITGVVCGVRVEDVEDPVMKKTRLLGKLVDEQARGKGRLTIHGSHSVVFQVSSPGKSLRRRPGWHAGMADGMSMRPHAGSVGCRRRAVHGRR